MAIVISLGERTETLVCFKLTALSSFLYGKPFLESNRDQVSLTASSQSLHSCVMVLPVILRYAEGGDPIRSL